MRNYILGEIITTKRVNPSDTILPTAAGLRDKCFTAICGFFKFKNIVFNFELKAV